MAGLRRSARNKPGGFAGRLAIAGRAWKPHWPIKDDLVQVVHDDDQGVAAWWAATVVGNNRDAFLFNEEEPEPLWRVEYADVGNGIEREDQITEDRIRKRFQDPAAMQEVLDDRDLLHRIFGALPDSILFIRAIKEMCPPKVDNIAIIASLVSKKWHEGPLKAAQVQFVMNGFLGIDMHTFNAVRERGLRQALFVDVTEHWEVLEGAIRLPLEIFTRRHTLTSLDLTCWDSWGGIDDAIGGVVKLLENCRALRRLNLSGCGIGHAGMITVAQSLPGWPALSMLQLRGEPLYGNRCVTALEATLPRCQALTAMDLGWNSVGPEGARVLAPQLPACHVLTTLHLDGNCFGVEGAVALAAQLGGCKALTELSLGSNAFGVEGAAALAAKLSGCCALTALRLAHNDIGREGTNALVTRLCDCHKLRVLDLTGNDLWYSIMGNVLRHHAAPALHVVQVEENLQLQKDSSRQKAGVKGAVWVGIRDVDDVEMYFNETIVQAALDDDLQHSWCHLLDDVLLVPWGLQAPGSYIRIFDPDHFGDT